MDAFSVNMEVVLVGLVFSKEIFMFGEDTPVFSGEVLVKNSRGKLFNVMVRELCPVFAAGLKYLSTGERVYVKGTLEFTRDDRILVHANTLKAFEEDTKDGVCTLCVDEEKGISKSFADSLFPTYDEYEDYEESRVTE